MPGPRSSRGYSLLEVSFVMGLMATVGGVAVPQLLASLDDFRVAGAARYLSSRFQRTRMEAVTRSTEVALRFTEIAGGYAFAVYIDGDNDGVRTQDIKSGRDRPLGPPERLPDRFAGVDFGVLPGLPAVDGGSAPGNDPIKLGVSDLLSFSANGTSSSGSVYIRGRRNTQYVVRVFGVTAKTRVLKYSTSARRWRSL